MNKKFSTLLTAGLLVGGSLFSFVDAAIIKSQADLDKFLVGGVLTLPAGDNELEFAAEEENGYSFGNKGYMVVKNDNVKIFASTGGKVAVNGRLIIAKNGVSVSNLHLVNTANGNGGYWNMNAVSVFADNVTLTNNTIEIKPGESEAIGNGIVVFPQNTEVNYTISGNKIIGASAQQANDASTGILLSVNSEVNERKGQAGQPLEYGADFKFTTADVKKGLDASAIAKANTYEGCFLDLVQQEGVVLTGTTSNGAYSYAKVTFDKDKDYNTEALKDALNSAGEKAVVDVAGASTADLLGALKDEMISSDIAVACSDGNVLFGEAENLNNGKAPVLAGITPAVEKVSGQELIKSATSEYSLLALTDDQGKAHVISVDTDGKVVVDADPSILTDKAFLWKMESGTNADGTRWFKFKNLKTEKYLTIGEDAGATDAFFSKNKTTYNKGIALGLKIESGALSTDNSGYAYVALYKAGNNVLTAGQLNWYEQDGFSVTIKYQDPEDATKFTEEDIAGNPFVGHLTPMSYDKTAHKFSKATNSSKEFYLMNADGDYIVAQKYASNGSVSSQATYTFTTITAQALAHEIEREEGKYFGLFQAEVSAKYTDLQTLGEIDVLKVKVSSDWNTVGRLDLGTEEVPTLAASFATQLKPIKIALGSNEIVKAKDLLKKGKFYTVERIASKATPKNKLGFLSVAQDDQYNGYTFVSTYGNDLEVQWALTRKDGKYVFANREATYEKWDDIAENALYKTATPDEYRYGTDIYRIKPVDKHGADDGYVTLKDVKNNKFHIGFSSNVFKGNAWFTENHSGTDNHTIGLDTDSEKALEFTATEYAAARTKKHLDEEGEGHTDMYYPSDSIYVISTIGYYDGNTYKEDCKDTLKVVSYSFVNQFIEPLIWNEDEQKYESQVYENEALKKRFEKVEEAAKAAHKFAIRKDGEKRNLRLVNHLNWNNSSEYSTAPMHQDFNEWRKVYAGDATTGLLSTTGLYDRTENDLFVVEPTAKPMYRPVINPLDTISIFRNDNHQSILFENNSFLGMENLAQYPQIAPGMVADTAYVRNETYRPQYMLVVAPEIHPAGMWCEKHSSETCEHAVPTQGWIEGRYLVNLVDTAIAWNNDNKHKGDNPYINSENYYRLGFVQAKHIEDSLIIASTNDTLIVGTPEYNQAKFAFRYVDTEELSFVIETANFRKLPNATEAEQDGLGYIKWMNGVVVVVDDIKNADVFNMDEEFEGQPTDNETIATSEVVVIAGEGNVTIVNAAGKKVVITNILGQTVANTVISSDNATIAAPQGVVVVAVEGEEAVKAIVK